MLSPPLVQQWPVAMQALVKLFVLPQDLTAATNGANGAAADGADADDVVTADLEATGYQASYSKLGAAEPDGRARMAAIEARIGDARELLARNLNALCAAKPGVIPPCVCSDRTTLTVQTARRRAGAVRRAVPRLSRFAARHDTVKDELHEVAQTRECEVYDSGFRRHRALRQDQGTRPWADTAGECASSPNRASRHAAR